MDLADVLGLLRRRWLALALCLVAGFSGAQMVTNRTPESFQSSGRLIVSIPQANSTNEALQGVQLSTQLLRSYARVATSRSAAARVKQQLGLTETIGELQSKVAASPEPETLLITVSAVDRDPLRAATIANAVAAGLIDTVQQLEAGRDAPVVASVVDPAVPNFTPIAPKPRTNSLLGLVVGTVTGLSLALALDALDRTIKSPAQATAIFQVPLLGLVPHRRDAADRPLITADDPLAPASEAYRSIRTAMRYIDPDRPVRTVVVTSPSASEGKTATASNLAVALAQSGERVMLVDADLRRARVATMFGLLDEVGLTSVVTRQIPLPDAVQGWRDTLAVVASGPLPPNPSELLGSQSMRSVIDEMDAIADIVIFDAPPVLPVTDAVVLATQVDGVIVVARHGRTQRSLAAEACRRLDAVNAHVLGVVVTAVPGSASRGYYEDYSYIQPYEERPRGRSLSGLVGSRRGRGGD